MAEHDREGEKGKMTVEEAGHKGGQRVRELVEEGKKEEGGEESGSRSHSGTGTSGHTSHHSGSGHKDQEHEHTRGSSETTRGGTSEQHREAGRQSHKND